MPQLILKLKGEDFYKGLSLQSSFPIGGMWQQLNNYDPFQKLGRLFPTLGPTRKDASSIPIVIRSFEYYSDGTNRFLYAFGDSTVVGTNGAYKINLDTDAITDLSASVHTNTTGTQSSSTVRYWKGKIVYDQAGGGQSFRSINPAGTSDTNILSSGIVSSYDHPSVIGPDGYLYFLNGQYIGRLIISTGTSGNSATTFDTLDSNLIGRDIDHDGQYIFAGFDNNLNKLSGITADCQIIVWDRSKAYAEKRYTIKEAYIIAVRCLGQTCYVLTPGGWYVCSIASEPVLLYPMTSESPFNKFPTDYNGVAKNGHSLYWTDNSGAAFVYAIGQKIAGKTKIVYSPYTATSTTENQRAIAISNDYIYVSTSISRVYKLNSATGAQVSAQSCPQYLPAPFTFSYAKIKLRTALGSGDEVSFSLINSDGEIISGSETQGFSTVGAKKTLVFRRIASGGATITDFTDLYPYILTNVEISEIEVYGDALPGNHNIQI